MSKKQSKLEYLLNNVSYDIVLSTYEDGHLAEAVIDIGGDVVRYRCYETSDGEFMICEK